MLTNDTPRQSSTTLHVNEMDCPEDVSAIEKVLVSDSRITSVSANLIAGEVTILHEEGVTVTDLVRTIAKAGLKSFQKGDRRNDTATSATRRYRFLSVAISGLLTGVGLTGSWFEFFSNGIVRGVFILAIVSGGWFIAPKALTAARKLRPDMNLLMVVAVLGAMGIGEWSEAAVVTFLFALSELLEAYSVARARRAIKSLLEVAPKTALVKRGDSFEELPVESVLVGETIAVKSGARIALDGEVSSGRSAVNQAPVTGESMPMDKEIGDPVFAGSINGEGSLEVRVGKAFKDSTLSRIIHLVEEAQSKKAPTQRFVDRFAAYYTPVVLALSLLVFIAPPLLWDDEWSIWIYRALVLLVIACPCALVISTPVSIVSGLTALARHGVLVKGGAFLEAIGRIKALAVDKTGTITEGRPTVRSAVTINALSVREILRIAAAIEIHSDHPLAQAILRHAEEERVTFARGENYQSITGKGAEADINGLRYFVGNRHFLPEISLYLEEMESRLREFEEQACSVVIVGKKRHADYPGEVMGLLAIGDAVRDEARSAIQTLHDSGVGKIVMLSGDNQQTVDTIARQVGIDDAKGELLPEQKVKEVQDLLSQHRHVGMIGDGLNDSPAMATASVGIAMGVVGTDTAIETADIALMKDDLSKVAEAVKFGRRTVNVVQVNIGFALSLKALFLGLAIFGYTSLWLAILADTGATLIVIANALRLLSTKE